MTNADSECPGSDRPDGSDQSDRSDENRDRRRRVMPPSGGYRRLRSFQVAQLVYDGTVVFCNRFVDRRSRTHDQMVQAARSGVQNIAEGSMAAAISKKTELKLTGVARASLEELLLDYEDFLRQRGMRIWDKESPQAKAVRARYHTASSHSDSLDCYDIETAAPEEAANTLICLINQASYLLARQLERLEQSFVEGGGFTERLYKARIERREFGEPGSPAPTAPAPACPRCGKPMILRKVRQGPRAGNAFWGCSDYPDCTGTRTIKRGHPGSAGDDASGGRS